MPTVVKHREHIAAKPHKCIFCGCPISKGEKYWREAIVHNSDFYEWIYHPECENVANKLGMFNDYDNGVSEEDFHEYIEAYVSDKFRDETDDVPQSIDSLDTFHKVRLIIDTWNRPDFVLSRKKEHLRRLQWAAKSRYHCNRQTDFENKIRNLQKEIKELEELINTTKK